MSELFRVYEEYECGEDGYPFAWHQIPFDHPVVADTLASYGIKDEVRTQAGNRCVRCGHPYDKGMGEWSPCDRSCTHGGPVRVWRHGIAEWDVVDHVEPWQLPGPKREARWRILTVHHLNGEKRDCRWWNLAALCQRCHLTIQGKVEMDRPYDKPHTEWFVPYVCGFYAAKYLDLELTREQALARAEELLSFELRQDALFTEHA